MNMKFYLKISSMLVAAAFLSTLPVEAQTFRQTKQGITGTTQGMDIEIQFVSPEIVRVVKAPEGRSFTKKSLSVVKSPESMSVTTEKKGETVSLKSNAVRVDFNVETGRISFFDKQGKALFTEKDYGAQFTPFNDAGNQTFSVRQAFLLAIYGLGQQQVDDLNQRNHKHFMRQRALHASVPIIQSTKGYGMFWDNYSPTTYTDNPQEMSFDSEVGECMDYYFMYGGNADGVIAQIRDLTGQAPMYPLWTFGFWQSRERYKSQQETMEVVDKYRELGVPLDGIIQDWQYWGKYGWNAMKFDEDRYPDPGSMMKELHEMDVRLMISVWSKIDAQSEVGKQAKEKGYYIPGSDWIDFFNPDAAAFYWQNFRTGLLKYGIDAWWQDATEPENDDLQNRRINREQTPGEVYRNVYPMYVSKTIYEGLRQDDPDRRAMIFTRSGFSGMQRYAAATWSGDVGHDWETLRRQIVGGLGQMATGLPWWTYDAGGFFRPGDQYTNTGYHEQLIRWIQAGTFFPLMRVHGYMSNTEPWRYGEKVEHIIARYLDLRYRLLPYIYSQNAAVSFNGSTLMRPLVMDFPEDRFALEQNYQFMFGPSILVAPVVESGVNRMKVYLPECSAGWVDFWNGTPHKGGIFTDVNVDLMKTPLFVKAGSILPLGPQKQYAAEETEQPWEIRIYPGADGSYSVYEDEGINYNYEKGQFCTFDLKWNDSDKTLTISDRKGSFAGMKERMDFNIVIVTPESGTGIYQSKVNKSIVYEGKSMVISL